VSEVSTFVSLKLRVHFSELLNSNTDYMGNFCSWIFCHTISGIVKF